MLFYSLFLITMTVLLFIGVNRMFLEAKSLKESLFTDGLVVNNKFKSVESIRLFFVFSIVFSVLTFFLFSTIVDIFIEGVTEPIILIAPLKIAIVAISFFYGMIMSSLLNMYFTKIKLKEEWGEYLIMKRESKMFFSINERLFFKVLLIVLFICSFLIFNRYTSFEIDEVVISDFLDVRSDSYLYSEVKELQHIEKINPLVGKEFVDKHYLILFNDGRIWNSRDEGFSDYDSDFDVIDLIQEKTNLEMIYKEFK